MPPQSKPRKARNPSKVSLIISVAFHAVLLLVLFYFAAREGLLGKKLNTIAVQMIKEKLPEKPKEPEKPKIEPPKAEPPKMETPKIVEVPKVQAPTVSTPPVVAPPNSEMPSFEFGGGKTVETSSDPVQLFKGYMEYVLRQKWHRPEDEADDDFVAEVAVSVDRHGNIENSTWLKGSGDERWDATVKQVFTVVKNFDRPPPTNFPLRVTIRFDVQSQATEPILQ
jgi:outer membrane biosynthesis protein TonB